MSSSTGAAAATYVGRLSYVIYRIERGCRVGQITGVILLGGGMMLKKRWSRRGQWGLLMAATVVVAEPAWAQGGAEALRADSTPEVVQASVPCCRWSSWSIGLLDGPLELSPLAATMSWSYTSIAESGFGFEAIAATAPAIDLLGLLNLGVDTNVLWGVRAKGGALFAKAGATVVGLAAEGGGDVLLGLNLGGGFIVPGEGLRLRVDASRRFFGAGSLGSRGWSLWGISVGLARPLGTPR